MVKDMYNERVKSTINPILSVVIWFFATYIFTIIWGISEIIFEFENPLIMQITCLLETVWFGWFLITKIMTELEYEILENKLIIRKVLSKRSSIVCLVAIDNIKVVTKEKSKCKKFHKGKIKNFVRPGLKKNAYFIAYKDIDTTKAIKLSLSKEIVNLLK